MYLRIFATILIVLHSLLLIGQGYVIDDYRVDLRLHENGDIYITEDISVNFLERRRGIIRNIPYVYKFEGKRIKINISEIEVPGHEIKMSNKKGEKIIRIGNPNRYLTGTESYQISYKVSGAIVAYEDWQELYWNIIPSDWDTSIDKFSYEIKLPLPLDLVAADYKVYSGDKSSQENISTIVFADQTLSGRGLLSLKPSQGVTVAIKLPQNYVPVQIVSEQKRSSHQIQPKGSWLAAMGMLLAGIWAFLRWDKNKASISHPTPQSYPPDHMSAAQVGVFIDHRANTRDALALLPQWGAEGWILMQKQEDDDTLITKLKELPTDLPDYEHTLFDAIFKDGDSVSFSVLKYNISSSLYKVLTQLSSELKESDLYDARSVKWFHSWRTAVGSLCLIGIAVFIMICCQWFIAGVLLIALAVFLLINILLRPKYSKEGTRVISQLRGFKKFIEEDHPKDYAVLMKSDPKYFDKILPYAVALGLDESFLTQFSSHHDYQPPWYLYEPTSTLRQHTPSFSSSYSTKEISSVFSATKSVPSGGSSGSISGGSVGGGFGGGGGSSW